MKHEATWCVSKLRRRARCVCVGTRVYLAWQGGLGSVFGPLESIPDSVAQTLQRAPRLLSQVSQPVHRYCS
jgi:hypothetical protein